MPSLETLVSQTANQGNPIDSLRLFLEEEARIEAAGQIDRMRFVGYVLDLGYESAKIITSDPYKIAVGGIPRGSFLIMTPAKASTAPLHFTLLRVNGVSPTPLTNQVQQTYFELHKKSMPELDVWTQSELQWGALDCDVLGMFYADPDDVTKLSFSGDVNNVVSAHRYKVYAPDHQLLTLIVNGTVREEDVREIGGLRSTECKLLMSTGSSRVPVRISIRDFKGARTAMFGKTRLGKLNVVKLIAKGALDATLEDRSVGQLIFDVNGEYANDNPQDGNRSLRSAYEERCRVYALTQRSATPSEPLRLNFYEHPDATIEVLASLLEQDNQRANYVRSFASVRLPAVAEIQSQGAADRIRPIRKIQLYWAILYKAGFAADERRLRALNLVSTPHGPRMFDPHFAAALRNAVYGNASAPAPNSLSTLVSELERISDFRRNNPGHASLVSSSGNQVFDPDDVAMLDFLAPASGSGPTILRPYTQYHAPNASDFINDILSHLDAGSTVILDLGNATDQVRRYFSDMLSRHVFAHQEEKFVTNSLGRHFIQLYFEEAHNLFPPDSKDLTGVYARFAKEGAKFQIGMV